MLENMADRLRDQLQSTLGSAYLIERELRGGGMSRVFVATETALDRRVVIKVLPSALAEGMSVERFKREIGFAARLQHPHIVPVLTAGETGGLPYYTMPFVDGESLRARLVTGPMSVQKVVSVLRDVAKALAYAHDHGVIHRDIKPDNVLLSGGAAAVTDFGVGKAVSAATTSTETLTRGGTAIGTPEYMAPEQAAADPNADHRVDIYAFGVMAYELIAGNPPFHGRTPQQLLAAQMVERPRPIENVSPGVPHLLAQMVMKCLEKEADQRPQSARDLLIDLDRISAGDGDAGGQPSTQSGSRPVRTVGLATLATIAIVVAALIVMRAAGIGPFKSLIAAGKLAERDKLLVTDFRAVGADSSLSGIVAEAMRIDLGQSPVVTVVPPSSISAALMRMRRDRTSRVDLTLAREIAAREGIKGIVDGGVTPLGTGYVVTVRLVEASTGDDLAAFRETIDGPGELIPTLDKLSGQLRGKIGESFRTVRANPPLAQVTTSSLDALRKYAAGQRAFDVEGDLPKSVDLFREAIAIDTAFAMAYRALAVSLNALGMSRASIDSALNLAYRHRERLTDLERYMTIGTYFANGNQRDRKRSADAYESVLELDSLNIGGLNNLGRILVDRREFARAQQLFRRSVIGGTARPALYINLFDVQLRLSNFAAAESTEAVARREFPTFPVLRFMKVALFNARGQLDSVKKSADHLRSTETDASLRSIATWFARDVELIHGHLNEAARLAQEGYAIDEARGAAIPPLTRALEDVWLDIWHRERPLVGARKLDAALARMPLASLPRENRRFACSITLIGTLKPCFDLAVVYAMAGRPDRARAIISESNAAITDTAVRRQLAPAGHVALAEVALAEKRPLDAIAEFKLSDRLPDGPRDGCIHCFLGEIARAYDAAGSQDSAIAIMERYLSAPLVPTWPHDQYLARFHHRLGELYDARGDSKKAIPHYEHFAELWKTADPDLQPKVLPVQQRLSVLRRLNPASR
jgi:tetratricopeptide (TPR) repeat protein